MSGYRSFHRETLGKFPIWSIASSPLLTTTSTAHQKLSAWRIWVACGDGIVRGYLVNEKSLNTTTSDALDAAACNVQLTHILLGANQSKPNTVENDDDDDVSTRCIGCSQVKVVRKYTGDDDTAGDLIIISSDLSGKIRIWTLPEDMDNELSDSAASDEPACPEIVQEFSVENATGTCIQIMPPNVSGVGDILLAVPCLDGTIALVATGVTTPTATRDPTPAGEIVHRWSKATSSIALSEAFSPTQKSLVIGRQDGLVEVFGDKHHRLIQHEAPVRSVAVTPDGHLLMSASDDGMVCVWDNSRAAPVLVHHVVQAHETWVLGLTALSDSRRFLSCGADRKLSAWAFSEMDNQALHTFTTDETVWAMDALTTKSSSSSLTSTTTQTRLVTGSENGGLHIFTLES